MTTLPQTTTVRPQALGHGLSAHLPPITVSATPAATMTGRDVWRVMRNNFWLILLLMMVFGAAGFALNWVWAMKWPVYTTRGTLQLAKRTMIDPLNDRYIETPDSRLLIDQKSQAQMLVSDRPLADLLTDPANKDLLDDLRATDLFVRFQRSSGDLDSTAVKDYLQSNFRATPVPDTNLITVSLEGSSPEVIRTWLRALVTAHVRRESRTANEQLDKQKTLLENTLKGVQAERNARRTEAKSLRDNLDTQAKTAAMQEIELRELQATYLKMKGDAAEARAMANRVQEQLKNGEPIGEVEKAVTADPTVAQLTTQLLVMDIDLNVQKGASEKPEYQRMQARRDEMDAQRKALCERLRSEYNARWRSQLEDTAVTKENGSASLRAQITDLEKAFTTIASDQARLRSLDEQELSLGEQASKISDKILLLTSIKTEPGQEGTGEQDPIRWAYAPEVPQQMTRPQLKWVLPMAMVLGLLVAVGIAFLREMLDDTVRTPRDVSRVGQLNLLGMIADEADDPQVEDARLAIFDAPQSLTAEQFRQVRARLLQTSSLEQMRSVLVTGPSPLDGKTTVAANLAAGLALNGRKILLVDANFRRPELHRLFGFDNAAGFGDVLSASAALKDLAHATRIPNLSVLCSGTKPANATELIESQLLSDFIESACQEYDHVIFDSGPMLIVSESAALAPRVDGVISVVRAHSESRGLLQRMRDALRQLKAEHIGVVLNAVRSRGGGYYRGNIKAYYRYHSAD